MQEKPKSFEKYKSNSRFYYVIRFDIEFDKTIAAWKYDEVKLPYGQPTYDKIVDAMVSFKYPIDKMQAIINNYLLDQNDVEAKNDFVEMQSWRKYSKDYAKEIMINF